MAPGDDQAHLPSTPATRWQLLVAFLLAPLALIAHIQRRYVGILKGAHC